MVPFLSVCVKIATTLLLSGSGRKLAHAVPTAFKKKFARL
jgi:hypothetical protein